MRFVLWTCLPLAPSRRVVSTDERGQYMPCPLVVVNQSLCDSTLLLEPLIRCQPAVHVGHAHERGHAHTFVHKLRPFPRSRQSPAKKLWPTCNEQPPKLTYKSTFSLATPRCPSFSIALLPARYRMTSSSQSLRQQTASSEGFGKKTGFKILGGSNGKGTNYFEG